MQNKDPANDMCFYKRTLLGMGLWWFRCISSSTKSEEMGKERGGET